MPRVFAQFRRATSGAEVRSVDVIRRGLPAQLIEHTRQVCMSLVGVEVENLPTQSLRNGIDWDQQVTHPGILQPKLAQD